MDIVIYSQGSGLCAFAIEGIKEIIEGTSYEVTATTNRGSGYKGVTLVRGEVYAVIDLDYILNGESDFKSKFAILVENGTEKYCIEVGEVKTLQGVEDSQIEEVHSILNTKLVERLAKVDNEIVCVIDPLRIIEEVKMRGVMKTDEQ